MGIAEGRDPKIVRNLLRAECELWAVRCFDVNLGYCQHTVNVRQSSQVLQALTGFREAGQ